MKHKVKRVDNLMHKGCEPHWQCVHCGIYVPFHCYKREEIENSNCEDGYMGIGVKKNE
jgi:hypothetical protein